MAVGDFTDQADSYSRARPNYPSALIDLLVQDADLQLGDPVADLGAGTSIFTRKLVQRGFQVSAVEPNAAMRKLGADLPVRWFDGTFESTQLPTESQRWAVAALAFHWADPMRTLPKLRRILQPASLLTVLWNHKAMDAHPILRWTADSLQRHAPGFREMYDGTPWDAVLASTGDFAFVGKRVMRRRVSMNRRRYVDLWRSHHWLQQTAGPHSFAAFIAELEAHLAAEQIESVEAPYD